MKLNEVGKQLSETDISVIENMVGGNLPEDYKSFLLSNNGGQLDDEGYIYFIDPDKDEVFSKGTDLNYFLNNDEISEYYSNLTNENFISSKCLPIAVDSFDNVIMIDLNTNEVLFADCSSEANPQFKTAKIANSFTEFINNIKSS